MRKPHPNVRSLRKEMPSAERRLWYFIRRRQLGGFHFRRQHTIGPFVADFACLEASLVLELDGDQHGLEAASARDAARDACIEAEGFDVLRIWNREVYSNIDGVLELILDAANNGVRAKELAERGF
jgi:very-short-patch-repair endonuclease